MTFGNRVLIGAALSGILFGTVARAQKQAPMTTEQRQEYRDKLLKILPPVPSFAEWIKKTNALPPDFNSLPRQELMPDPLTFFDGHKVTTAAQWTARREEISKLQQKYVWGTFPPKPKISKVNVLDERHDPNGYTVRNLSLVFGPGDKATMRVRVYIPDGKGPFPVMIGTSLAGWASTVIPRGYIAAGYAGNDGMDDAAGIAPLYPDYDFATLPRRAWAASLVIDYLDTLPQVDQKHIAITGYSRDGKMVAIAAAMDTRIAAVVAGSTGVGGVLPWRATGERGFGEGIESTTRSYPTWFAPQLRFFTGREDRLPVDGNSLAAMIAPRSILMVFGKSDQVSSSWGNEQTYYTALKVFKLLGVPDHIATLMVPGFHGADDREADMDWLDEQFGRSTKKWTNNLIFQWDWNSWKTDTKTSLDLAKYPAHKSDDLLKTAAGGTITSVADWEKKADEDRKVVLSMLGPAPLELSPADSALRGFGGGGTGCGTSGCSGCGSSGWSGCSGQARVGNSSSGGRCGSSGSGRSEARRRPGLRRSASCADRECSGDVYRCRRCGAESWAASPEPAAVGHQQWRRFVWLAGAGEERGGIAACDVWGDRRRSVLSEGHAGRQEAADRDLAARI